MTGLENWPAIFVGFVGAPSTSKKKKGVLLLWSCTDGHGEGRPGRPYVWPLVWWPSRAVVSDWLWGVLEETTGHWSTSRPLQGTDVSKPSKMQTTKQSQPVMRGCLPRGSIPLARFNTGNWVAAVYCIANRTVVVRHQQTKILCVRRIPGPPTGQTLKTNLVL